MRKDELKTFMRDGEPKKTGQIVALYQDVARLHDRGEGAAHFSWREVERDEEGRLRLNLRAEGNLTKDLRDRNLHDFAEVVYCLATGNASAESMAWDGGRKINEPVLREIVLTLTGRNQSVDALVEKLREPYVDEDTFFAGYTTVDELEAMEAFQRDRRVKAAGEETLREAERLKQQAKRERQERWQRLKGVGGAVLALLIISFIVRSCRTMSTPSVDPVKIPHVSQPMPLPQHTPVLPQE